MVESWRRHYNPASEHPSVYAIEGKRLCWARSDPVGYRALRCARSTRALGRRPPQPWLERRSKGRPRKGGELRSFQPRPPAAASLTQSSEDAAASERLSQGLTPSSAVLNTGIRWCERNEATRSRVQLPWPVLSPLRLRRPAIRWSLAINANSRTAAYDISWSAVALPTPAQPGQADLAVYAA